MNQEECLADIEALESIFQTTIINGENVTGSVTSRITCACTNACTCPPCSNAGVSGANILAMTEVLTLIFQTTQIVGSRDSNTTLVEEQAAATVMEVLQLETLQEAFQTPVVKEQFGEFTVGKIKASSNITDVTFVESAVSDRFFVFLFARLLPHVL